MKYVYFTEFDGATKRVGEYNCKSNLRASQMSDPSNRILYNMLETINLKVCLGVKSLQWETEDGTTHILRRKEE